MYERFTDRARKVMLLANHEAERFNHEYIAPEHILLGLVKEGSGVAACVLKNLGVDLRRIRLEVEKLMSVGPDPGAPAGKLPLTPLAKNVIEYAMAEARDLGHNCVGTEHLLLGLVREEEGVAAQVLMNLGLRLHAVREEVMAVLGHRTEVSSPPVPPEPLKLPLNEDARSVLRTAEAAARLSRHSAVCTGYVLLGLVRQSGTLASRVLCQGGVSEQLVLGEIRTACPESPPFPESAAPPRSLWTHYVVHVARDEARALSPHRELEEQIRQLDREKENAVAEGQFEKAARLRDQVDDLKKGLPKTPWTIGPEHLLLGLLRDPGSEALRIVQAAGVDPETLRAAVLRELGASGSQDQTEGKP